MKSNEMQIQVYRNDEGIPSFRYPKKMECRQGVWTNSRVVLCITRRVVKRKIYEPFVKKSTWPL